MGTRCEPIHYSPWWRLLFHTPFLCCLRLLPSQDNYRKNAMGLLGLIEHDSSRSVLGVANLESLDPPVKLGIFRGAEGLCGPDMDELLSGEL